jgi:hemerythrin-like metal-binding protein
MTSETNRIVRHIEWDPSYSVGVAELDAQHQGLIKIINHLMDVISDVPPEEEVKKIIGEIVAYKAMHFGTEEKYFHEFNFEGTEEHEKKHREFNVQVEAVQKQYEGDTIGFAFAIVDFLSDWLIGHLMGMDKKYTTCFNEHGLH